MSRLTGRFKIDLNCYASEIYPIALYKEVKGRVRKWWEHCQSFQTREEARAYYAKMGIKEKIDGLPEYLD